MKQWSDLEFSEQQEIKQKANDWWDKYKSHVDSLIKSNPLSFPPSGSDMFHPELFKAAHWRWFKEMFRK
jgi:hypothetical protein